MEGSVRSIPMETEDVSNKSSMLAIRDLADSALGGILPLIDIERFFMRELRTLELSSLCCVFPSVRNHFMRSRTIIGTFPRTLDVVSLFGRVPNAGDLKPMLETFTPSSVVIRFGKADRVPYDVLMAFDGIQPFYSLDLHFDAGDLILLRGPYFVRKLTIHQNRWHPADNAVQASLDGASNVKELFLEHGRFDVVMAAHLEHAPLSHIKMQSVSVSQFEIPQIVNWLVTRKRLIDLRIIDFPYWVQPTTNVKLFRTLLTRILALRGLNHFEFSVGGRFVNLNGLLRLRKLRSVRINIEIHLEFSLRSHLHRVLRALTRKTVTIGLYCGRDWSCNHRRASGREFIKRLKENFPGFEYVACDGLDSADLVLL